MDEQTDCHSYVRAVVLCNVIFDAQMFGNTAQFSSDKIFGYSHV